MENEEISRNIISKIFYERGNNALKRFQKELLLGIENPKLLSILEYVKNQAKDFFRPALISLSCEAVGGNPNDTVDLGLIISLAGAGIGIHDDIIDNSQTKGFRRTILGHYTLNDSLLVGDLLIVKGLCAFNYLLQKNQDIKKVAEVIRAIQSHYFEICEGVFMEKNWQQNFDIKLDYCYDVLWKYSSDGEACTRIGALFGNASQKEVEALADYGRRLCYATRLAEEIRDTLNLKGDLIRRLKFESIPLPILIAAKSSGYRNELKSIFKNDIGPDQISKLLGICFETNSFEPIITLAKNTIEDGEKIIQILRPSESRKVLSLLIENAFQEELVQMCI
ncbi:MAG: polyprenyl synthetase family protein [Candidatus Bathyarchaeota archaeon]